MPPGDLAVGPQEEHGLVILIRADLALLALAAPAEAQVRRYAGLHADPGHGQQLPVSDDLHQLHPLALVDPRAAEAPLVADALHAEQAHQQRLNENRDPDGNQDPDHAHLGHALSPDSTGAVIWLSASRIRSSAFVLRPYRPLRMILWASTGTASAFTSSGVTKSRPRMRASA